MSAPSASLLTSCPHAHILPHMRMPYPHTHTHTNTHTRSVLQYYPPCILICKILPPESSPTQTSPSQSHCQKRHKDEDGEFDCEFDCVFDLPRASRAALTIRVDELRHVRAPKHTSKGCRPTLGPWRSPRLSKKAGHCWSMVRQDTTSQ